MNSKKLARAVSFILCTAGAVSAAADKSLTWEDARERVGVAASHGGDGDRVPPDSNMMMVCDHALDGPGVPPCDLTDYQKRFEEVGPFRVAHVQCEDFFCLHKRVIASGLIMPAAEQVGAAPKELLDRITATRKEVDDKQARLEANERNIKELERQKTEIPSKKDAQEAAEKFEADTVKTVAKDGMDVATGSDLKKPKVGRDVVEGPIKDYANMEDKGVAAEHADEDKQDLDRKIDALKRENEKLNRELNNLVASLTVDSIRAAMLEQATGPSTAGAASSTAGPSSAPAAGGPPASAPAGSVGERAGSGDRGTGDARGVKADARGGGGPRADARSDSKPDTKPDAKPDARPDVKQGDVQMRGPD
jgi:hypothetical protein